MNRSLRLIIRKELYTIAEDILKSAKKDENGIYWETTEIDFSGNTQLKWIVNESIYSGTAGVTLFFLELSQTTKSLQYKTAAIEGAKWLIHRSKNNRTDNYSFYTGRMGVAFLMLKMHEYLKNKYYLNQAVIISKNCLDYLSTQPRAELLSGASGSLLVLLHLHSATKNKYILNCINEYIKFILGKILIWRQGICWDQDITQINALCGFSHGAAGIGFTFLELGAYFNNKAFYWIAEQAFLYERSYYNPKFRNWADLRKMNFSPQTDIEFRNAYEAKNWQFFFNNNDLNAWCHGAAGIGLSRLRGFELLKTEILKNEFKNCIQKTWQSDLKPNRYNLRHSICHGLPGNAFVFIEAFKHSNIKSYLELAELAGRYMINEKGINGHYVFNSRFGSEKSPELFTGNSGVGYFYLHLLNQAKGNNILYPKLSKRKVYKTQTLKYPYLKVDIKYMQLLVLKKAFPRIFIFLEKFKPDVLQDYFSKKLNYCSKNEYEVFMAYLTSSIKYFHPQLRRQLKDIYTLEKQIKCFQEKETNLALIHLKNVMRFEKKETPENLENVILSLSSEVRIITSKWNWHDIKSENDLAYLTQGVFQKILRRTINGVEEKELSPLNYLVLHAIKMGAKNLPEIINHLKERTDISSSHEVLSLSEYIFNQVMENIGCGVIEFSKSKKSS